MEPAAAWRPCGFQLANWSGEGPAAEVWAPTGFPVDYASIIGGLGTYGLQAYVPHEYSGGQQLVEPYCYSTASQTQHYGLIHNRAEVIDEQNRLAVKDNSGGKHIVVDPQNTEAKERVLSNDSRARDVLKQVSHEFKVDIDLIEEKMHRYPACLGAVDECYKVPRIVAIGPYHHHRAHLKQAEKVKHAAAIQCVKESGHLLEELYQEVAMATDSACCLYDKDVMAGIDCDDFRHMMFFDACFLVQYMLMRSRKEFDPSLHRFMGPNRIDIHHDVLLLENQLPWKVVETIMMFIPVRLEIFISIFMGYLQDQKTPRENAAALTLDKDYKPPHLLGIFWYYNVGISDENTKPQKLKPKKRSVSVSAIELAEIGIKLGPNKTTELGHMGLRQEVGSLFAELSLAPVSLDRNRASYLVNMAALELSTVESFSNARRAQDSAVCSYLLLLAMLVNREEDVQELRARGLLQGGRGLTNEEALSFFTSLQGLRLGVYYNRIMRDIEIYKEKRVVQTKVYGFFYNNIKIIAAVVTGIGAVAGIIGTLLSVKKSF